MKIHHIGYLVRNINKSKDAFLSLGYEIKKDILSDDYRQVYLCFLEKNGYLIELVSPFSEKSIVFNLLKKIGNCPYHICYETNTYEEDIDILKKKHYIICDNSHEAIALNNKRVCFMINPSIGMIELVEE